MSPTYENFSDSESESRNIKESKANSLFNGQDFHIFKSEMRATLMGSNMWTVVSEGKAKATDIEKDFIQSELDEYEDVIVDENSISTEASSSERVAIRKLKAKLKRVAIETERKDQKAYAIIMKALGRVPKSKVFDCITSKDLWESLCRWYDNADELTVLALKEEYNAIKLHGSFEKYMQRLDRIRSQLEAAGVTVSDRDHCQKMISGLGEEYFSFTSSILGTETELLRNPKQLALRIRAIEKLKIRVGDRDKKKDKDNKRVYSANAKYEPKICSNCGKKGHLLNDCWSKGGGKEGKGPKKFEKPPAKTEEKKAMMARRSMAEEVLLFVDSGSTDHLTNQIELLSEMRDLDCPIMTSSGEKIYARGFGDLEAKINGISIVFKDVLYVPEADSTLLSVNKITNQGFSVEFKKESISIKEGSEVVVEGAKIDGMYVLKAIANKHASKSYFTTKGHYWHERLAHYSNDYVKETLMEQGINQILNKEQCDTCLEGKMTQRPVSNVSSRNVSKPLEYISLDIMYFTDISRSGYKYALVIIDHFSKYVVGYLLKGKSEAGDYLLDYVSFMENRTSSKVIEIKGDNDRSFFSNETEAELRKRGIVVSKIMAYDKSQLGTIDRCIRNIRDRQRCLLRHSRLPNEFWEDAFKFSIRIINSMGSVSPYEKIFQRKPDLQRLKVFGCVATVYVRKELRKKEECTGRKMIFIGMLNQGYEFYNPSTKGTMESINVKFHEEQRGGQLLRRKVNTHYSSESEEEIFEIQSPRSEEESDIESDSSINSPEASIPDQQGTTVTTRSGRITKAPVRYALKAKGIIDLTTPRSILELEKMEDCELWKESMDKEIESLLENETWELADLPIRKRPTGVKWVWAKKQDGKRKSRLVVKGFTQRQGDDYDEVFAGVADNDSIRIFLAISLEKGLKIRQCDIETAFLNGEIEESTSIYIEPIPGYEYLFKGKYGKLKKALYGTKQGARQWNKKFKETMDLLGFEACISDASIFINVEKGILLLLFVDDMLIAAKEMEECLGIVNELGKYLKVKDLGSIKRFLGWNFDVTEDCIAMDQQDKIEKLLEENGMENANTADTPMTVQKLEKANPTKEERNFPYRSVLGSLGHIASGTRPDIQYAVNYLRRFQDNYDSNHITAVKRLLRYLKGTKGHRLTFKRGKIDEIKMFADADFATDEDRKSISGYCAYLGGNLVAWSSKKQNVVTLSTTEAEYLALGQSLSQSLWMRNLIEEITNEKLKIKLYEDNESCIAIAKNPIVKSRAKHIDIKLHFIRQHVDSGDVKIEPVNACDQIADVFTKALTRIPFQRHRENLRIEMGESVEIDE